MRWLLTLLAGTVLVSVAIGSAAALDVRGGTLQAFTFEVDYDLPEAPGPVGDLGCTFAQGLGTLTWGTVEGADGYRMYRSPSGDDWTALFEVFAPETSTTVGPQQIGHLYAVTAFNEVGESPLSNSVHCPSDGQRGGPHGLEGDEAGGKDLEPQSLLSDGLEGGDVTPTVTPTPETTATPEPDEGEGDGEELDPTSTPTPPAGAGVGQ